MRFVPVNRLLSHAIGNARAWILLDSYDCSAVSEDGVGGGEGVDVGLFGSGKL